MSKLLIILMKLKKNSEKNLNNRKNEKDNKIIWRKIEENQ